MKKPTRTSLKRRLDKKVSELVRARGKCEQCHSKKYLQACHIFSRKYLNTRWDLENLLCLCAKCHFLAHAEPIFFAEWVRIHLGEDRYELLKESHNIIYKPTLSDLETKLKVLSELKEGR